MVCLHTSNASRKNFKAGLSYNVSAFSFSSAKGFLQDFSKMKRNSSTNPGAPYRF